VWYLLALQHRIFVALFISSELKKKKKNKKELYISSFLLVTEQADLEYKNTMNAVP